LDGQDGVDLADELHADGEGGLGDGASELWCAEMPVRFGPSLGWCVLLLLTLKSSGTLSPSDRGAGSAVSA
jgi:hypothetical protein